MADDLQAIIQRVKAGNGSENDIQAITQALQTGQLILATGQGSVGVGRDVVNSSVILGNENIIGDRNIVIYGADAQAIQAVLNQYSSSEQSAEATSVDELVQQVRSRLHDDIQSLHGTMPLWGVDRWVPLGELFVDVNILEELSSSRRSELDDLWQDFSQNPSDRSLDRIGLGKERQRVSGLEVLAKNTNLMVVGKPGSGKTTYLQRVVTECNAGTLQAHRIPVLIKLREFVEDGREVAYSLERYLERCWRLSDAETRLVLDQGRALVLLDGLDEITGEDGKRIAKGIKRFSRAYPQVQIIVTGRTQNQESRFERFDYVEVADFNESQVWAFAEHWFKTVLGNESEGLTRAQEFLGLLFLEENQPIRELAITPILLSLTCIVFYQTGKFYSERSKLYEEGLELLLEQWDKTREIERDKIYRDLSVQRKLELLGYLAVKKFKQPQYVLFEQSEIEEYIEEFLKIGQQDVRVVLKALESQHGLLIERSRMIWSFSHLTFQEYLAAKWLCDRGNLQDIANHITQQHWREIILLAFTLPNANRFAQAMKVEIDSLVVSDEKIQNFLVWLNKKSQLAKAVCKSAATIRAIYFILILSIVGDYPQADSAHEIIRNIQNLNSASCYSTTRDIQLKLIRAYARNLNFAHTFSDPSRIARLLMSLDLSIAHSLSPECDLEKHDFNDFEPRLKRKIQILQKQIPHRHYVTLEISEDMIWGKNDHRWWQIDRLNWIKQNMDFDWHFTHTQKQLLQKYHDANKVLVEGLKQSEEVSSNVKSEIEETLLLPAIKVEET